VAQAVECLPSECKALSSNTCPGGGESPPGEGGGGELKIKQSNSTPYWAALTEFIKNKSLGLEA
jgi:hypothetical protein